MNLYIFAFSGIWLTARAVVVDKDEFSARAQLYQLAQDSDLNVTHIHSAWMEFECPVAENVPRTAKLLDNGDY